MATKINQDYYGDSAQWISVTGAGVEGNVKTSNRNIYRLCDGGYYQGGDFDLSASPWGIGESSLSSDFYCYALSDNGRLSIQKYFNKKGNTPLFLYRNSAGTTGMNLRGSSEIPQSIFRYECTGRVFPAADVTGSDTIKSTLTLDADSNVNNAGCAAAIPITYYNYYKSRLLCDVFWYRNSSDNLQTVRNALVIDLVVNPQNYEDIAEVYGMTLEGRFVYGTQGQVPQYGYWNDFCPSIGGTAREIPDFIKKTYYGDSYDKWTRPQRKLMTVGYWELSNTDSTTQIRYGGGRPADISLYQTPSIPSRYSNHDCFFGQFSEKRQVFDDVSYHWEFKYAWATSPSATPIYLNDGDIIPPNGYYMPYCILVIDDTTYNTIAESYFYALIHEAAFMGFPVIANRYDSTYDIPTSWIFIPVFDEHLITTGDFKRGTASLDLPNATWGDIFDDNMPVYDPEYQPPVPPEDEDDRGELSNNYPNRYTNAGGLAQWVVSQAQLIRLAAFLNGSYLPSQADLDGDFKGTNPMNYIVSVQKYPFTLPNVGNLANIYIGKINSGIQGKKLFADWGGVGVLPINTASSFDFGDIYIGHYYNDFRDYQSKILLFMPFVGTDELDPRLYIGHTVGLVYRVDYNTGSVIAEIKRDGLTMETKNSTISITVPFLAANMGAYQNQLAQLAYSKDMAKIKGVGTALSAGFTMAAGAQGTMSSGQPPLAALSNLAQAGMQLAANATQLSQLDYQIEHTAPQIGTISTAAAATAFFMDDRARLVIVRPKMLDYYDAAEYSHVIGNACCKAAKLRNFSGLTVCASAELGNLHTKGSTARQATEQERELLKRALQSGIYL